LVRYPSYLSTMPDTCKIGCVVGGLANAFRLVNEPAAFYQETNALMQRFILRKFTLAIIRAGVGKFMRRNVHPHFRSFLFNQVFKPILDDWMHMEDEFSKWLQEHFTSNIVQEVEPPESQGSYVPQTVQGTQENSQGLVLMPSASQLTADTYAPVTPASQSQDPCRPSGSFYVRDVVESFYSPPRVVWRRATYQGAIVSYDTAFATEIEPNEWWEMQFRSNQPIHWVRHVRPPTQQVASDQVLSFASQFALSESPQRLSQVSTLSQNLSVHDEQFFSCVSHSPSLARQQDALTTAVSEGQLQLESPDRPAVSATEEVGSPSVGREDFAQSTPVRPPPKKQSKKLSKKATRKRPTCSLCGGLVDSDDDCENPFCKSKAQSSRRKFFH